MTVLVFCCIEHTVVTDCSKMAAAFAVAPHWPAAWAGYLAFLYMSMTTHTITLCHRNIRLRFFGSSKYVLKGGEPWQCAVN